MRVSLHHLKTAPTPKGLQSENVCSVVACEKTCERMSAFVRVNRYARLSSGFANELREVFNGDSATVFGAEEEVTATRALYAVSCNLVARQNEPQVRRDWDEPFLVAFAVDEKVAVLQPNVVVRKSNEFCPS